MFSLQLASVSPLSTLISSLPNSHFSSLKLCITAGKRTAEGPSLRCFSSSSSIPRKPRLAAASGSAADAGNDGGKSELQLPGELRPELMPKHVAFIIDGHERWARRRGLTVHHGHKAGAMNLKNLASNCHKLGIEILTLYAFSTENWNRSKVEVDFLLGAYEDVIRSDVKELIAQHDMRFSAIGNTSRLPESLQAAISAAEKVSQANKGMHFIMALSYGGRDDIVEATRKIASRVEGGALRANDVDATLFEQQLMTTSSPETSTPSPDLLIRTGGELRLSNFLLWQLAYTEFYFANKMFPDFGENDLVDAIASFRCRQRRFGERK